ncbi:uncharacterized protein TM35_000212940 [Trypanosoma theileri]|uniref:Uncharacterized protein n=1 Tax=Trypanosoma theileri TaxID=67003 RepID=A0A1X0NT23_9TRYP|nr:uncharacterized protein TM35_000212940 [Trypanosoma theileri]ORC87688.1 hypothetical protein TM35_000212940 [Trypanosoma theileri]
MKRMNTEGVESIELQSCEVQEECCVRNDTHNVISSEHYGKSGTLHRWKNEKNTTTSLFHQRLSLQQVLRVLVMLWLLLPIPNPFLCCAAAAGTNGILTTITGCFPNMVVYDSQTTQHCEVDNANVLSTLSLKVGYYTPEGRLISGWPASLVEGTSLISFVPNSAAPGDMSLVILDDSQLEGPIPVTNNFTMNFVRYGATTASFTSNSAYYGLKTMVRTNLPNTNAIQNYLLVPPQSDCDAMAKKCTVAAGCYNLAISASFPIPGNYSLCLSASGWRGYYLPWGGIPLEVRVLVPNELYMNALGKNTLLLQDAVRGANVTDMNSVFLVKCPYSVCSRETLNSGDLIVSVDVCTGTAVTDRVYLSAKGGPFSATTGEYAVCADYGAEVGISPAALPVRVLQDPFVFNVTVITNTLVTIDVRGGDLSWRQEPYQVCAVLPNTPCESVATARDSVCVRSSTPNSPSVDVDISSLYSLYKLGADKVTFCFVASDVTFNGRRYVWSHDVRESFLPEGDSAVAPSSNKLSVGAIVGIVIAVVVVLVIVAVILYCVLRQRPQQEQQRPRKKVPMDVVKSRPTGNTTTVETTSNSLTTASTTEVTTTSASSRNTASSVQSDDSSQNTDDTVSSVLCWSNASPSEGQMKETSAPLFDPWPVYIFPTYAALYNRGPEKKKTIEKQKRIHEREPNNLTYSGRIRKMSESLEDICGPVLESPSNDSLEQFELQGIKQRKDEKYKQFRNNRRRDE